VLASINKAINTNRQGCGLPFINIEKKEWGIIMSVLGSQGVDARVEDDSKPMLITSAQENEN